MANEITEDQEPTTLAALPEVGRGPAPSPRLAAGPVPSDTDDVHLELLVRHESSSDASAARDVERRLGLTAPAAPAAKLRPGIDYSPTDGAPLEQEAAQVTDNPADRPAQVTPFEKSTLSPAFRDVARGVTELPRALVKGARDAAQEALNSAVALTDWLDRNSLSKLPMGGTGIGEDVPQFRTPEEQEARRKMPTGKAPQLPDIDAPTTVTGGLAKGAAQFLTAFGAVGKLPGLARLAALEEAGLAGKALSGAIKGALVDFAAFDPHEKRLSNLLKEHTDIAKPVTEFLAADPKDGELTARLKNTLEGAGLGVVTEGFIHALSALRSARQSRQAIAAQERAAETTTKAARDAALDVNAREAIAGLGDPNNPELFIQRPAAGGSTVSSSSSGTTPGTAGAEVLLDDGTVVKVDANGVVLEGVFKGQKPWFGSTEAKRPAWFPGQKKLDDAAQAAAGLDSADALRPPPSTGPDVFINWARVDTQDDVKRLMQETANRDRKGIEEARRGTRTWEETKLSAEQEDAWKILEERGNKALNAEQLTALRNLWVASGEKVKALAIAAEAAPNPANLFAFRKMMATHYMIQREMLGARAEIARSFNALKIPAKGAGIIPLRPDSPAGAAAQAGSGIRMADLEAALIQSGGTETTLALAQSVARLSDARLARELEVLVDQGAWALTKDAVLQAWYAALLSNPSTHVANALSGFATAAQQVGERGASAMVSSLLGTPDGVAAGEAFEMMAGFVDAFRDAMSAAKKSADTDLSTIGSVSDAAAAVKKLGDVSFLPDDIAAAAARRTKTEAKAGAFSPETWNVARDTFFGQVLGVVDGVTNTPGRLLEAGDEFFKTVGYRMEMRAQALRQATAEVRDGKIGPELLKGRVAEVVANPSDALRDIAFNQALYNTFQKDPAEALAKLGSAFQKLPGGRALLPFSRTPINILTYVSERSPFAPLVTDWRRDLAKGGAAADIAIARTATGMMTMLGAMDLYLKGSVTGGGPKDPRQRATMVRQGWQPYSFRIGDTYIGFSRVDPVGMTLGLAADIAETAVNASEQDGKAIEDVTIGAILAVARNVTSKTYMKGVADAFDAVANGERSGKRLAQRLLGSLVPSGVAAIARKEDPYLRVAHGLLEKVQSRIPGYSKDLTPARDLWGRTIDFRSPMGQDWDLLMPIYFKKHNPEPVDAELSRIGYYPSMPPEKFTVDGIPISLRDRPAIYSRYVELAGNEHKVSGVGAKDFLNKVVSGKHAEHSKTYAEATDGPEGDKQVFIEYVIRSYRQAARERLFQEFPELRVELDTKRDQAREKAARAGALE